MNKIHYNMRRGRVNKILLSQAEAVFGDWLDGGEIQGKEFVALNPLREDSSLGSFNTDFYRTENRHNSPLISPLRGAIAEDNERHQ